MATITVNQQNAAAKRQAAIDAVFPQGLPTEVAAEDGDPSPVTGVISTADFQAYRLASGAKFGVWTPANPNGTLLIVHQGHGGTSPGLEGFGVGDTIRLAVKHSITVVGCVMPGGTAWESGDGGTDHDNMPLSEFFEHIAVALNTLGQFDRVVMAGVSGGGWTTTLYAVLDTRVERSIPIAGTYPLALRDPNDPSEVGDYEQQHPFWHVPDAGSVISYEDAYILGAANGEQVQVLNVNDPNSFAGDGRHSDYEGPCNLVAADLGGVFRVWLNDPGNEHKIHLNAIYNVILPACGVVSEFRDNDAASYVGTWRPVPNPAIGVDSMQTDIQNQPASHAEWTIPVQDGSYELWLTWSVWPNRGTAVIWQVWQNSVLLISGTVNQRNEPSGDVVEEDRPWQIMGTLDALQGDVQVRIVSNATVGGYVIADAVRVVQLTGTPPPPPPPPVWNRTGDIAAALASGYPIRAVDGVVESTDPNWT